MSTTVSERLTPNYADLVARAVRICEVMGVMDYSGHVSARDGNDPNVMWINNRHASRSTLTAADIVPFDIAAGKRIGEGIEPPSEWAIHAEIYARRPDAMGIVHSHPKYILALSSVGVTLKPIGAIGAFLPEEGAPTFDSAVLINTRQRGVALANALGDAPVCVMRQHGIVAVGDCVEQAVMRLVRSERNAEQLAMALEIGTPRYIVGEELKVLNSENLGRHATQKTWRYFTESAATMGAFS
jgi:L-fuculose-phosphate aldolase